MPSSYFRFHYDNDYFTKIDEYYTQGINLEVTAPVIGKLPTAAVLYHPKNTFTRFGISADHFVYSPLSIRNDNILYGDRPFCANITLKFFAITSDPVKKEQISTALIAGLMGEGAGGREMQTAIHKWLRNVTPHGWQNQIRNDLILDYELNYEKQLASAGHFFLLNFIGGGRLGTHNDKLQTGFNFMAGHFDNPYQQQPARKKFSFYLYGQLRSALVGYDASLQGGLLNRQSPYTISAKDIQRFTLQGDYGIVLRFAKIYFEYCQSLLTREFASGNYHRWGGVRLGVGF